MTVEKMQEAIADVQRASERELAAEREAGRNSATKGTIYSKPTVPFKWDFMGSNGGLMVSNRSVG